MDLLDFADMVFDLVESGFVVVGAILLLVALGMSIHFLCFLSNAKNGVARVVEHYNVRLSVDEETGKETRQYQPVFELIGGVQSGLRKMSSQVHKRNAYPIGTVWPAQFHSRTGKIKTSRDREIWPAIIAMFWIIGIAFVCLPNIENGSNDIGFAYFFGGVGLAVMGAGILTMIKDRLRETRAMDVMAKLADVEIAYDSDGAAYDVPVLRILSGDYQGTESADVSIGSFSHEDIGQVMRARFDPYSGQISATEGKYRGSHFGPVMLLTGGIFAAIGYAMGSGLL